MAQPASDADDHCGEPLDAFTRHRCRAPRARGARRACGGTQGDVLVPRELDPEAES
jgi:hypothetical protein